MSVFVAIALVAAGLIAVALIILAFDIARGDVLGGGRHTMERARRLLVVATDRQTLEGAEAWVDEQHREHPKLQCFVLEGEDGHDLYMAVNGAVERNRPDAVVLFRHENDSHTQLEGIYGRLKESLSIPVDAIYVPTKELA